MKTFKKFVSVALLVGALAVSAVAGNYYSPSPVINPSASSPTNNLFGPNTNGIWPNALYPGTIITNVTKLDVSSASQVALQFDAAPLAANDNSNIVWTVGRSVTGGSPTNAAGSNLKIDWFATVTNTLSSVAGQTTTVVAMFGLAQGTVAQGGTAAGVPGKGAATTLYIGTVTTPALTTVTNYGVTASMLPP